MYQCVSRELWTQDCLENLVGAYSTVNFAGNAEIPLNPCINMILSKISLQITKGEIFAQTAPRFCRPMTDAALGLHLLILILGFAKLYLRQRRGPMSQLTGEKPLHSLHWSSAAPSSPTPMAAPAPTALPCRGSCWAEPTALPGLSLSPGRSPVPRAAPAGLWGWPWPPTPGSTWQDLALSEPSSSVAHSSSLLGKALPGKILLRPTHTVMWCPNLLNPQRWLFPRNINI